MDVDELLYENRKLRRENEELKEDVNVWREKYDSARFKIENELEPRIRREKRSYDNWVTNPER